MSVFHAYHIGSLGAGFTNQLNSLVNELIDAINHHRPAIILGKFRINYNTETTVPLSEVIDLDHLQELTGNKVRIYQHQDVELKFLRAYYGTYADGIEVTELVAKHFWRANTLRFPAGLNLNAILTDPIPGQVKTLYLKFAIGDTVVDVEHFEHTTTAVAYGITAVPARFNRPNLAHEDAYNHILKNIKFHPSLHNKAESIINGLTLTPKVNLIHLRNDLDALPFWGGINGMTPADFEVALNYCYISLIKQYFDISDEILVLTATPDNVVCKYLEENGYTYHHSDYKIEGQREVNAIVDLLMSSACTGTFIGNLNPVTKRGSTFDNPVWKRLQGGVQCVFIDLDHVQEPPQVVFTK